MEHVESLFKLVLALAIIFFAVFMSVWLVGLGLTMLLGTKVSLWPVLLILLGSRMFHGITGGND